MIAATTRSYIIIIIIILLKYNYTTTFTCSIPREIHSYELWTTEEQNELLSFLAQITQRATDKDEYRISTIELLFMSVRMMFVCVRTGKYS